MVGGVKKHSLSQGSTGDKISSLPNPLLHHIFSFLTMKDVVKTSLLSKRWKYLWTSLSVLNYPYLDRNSDAAVIIGTTLLRNECIKIQRLSIDLDPHVRACHIDSWINFAMRRNVEELHIKLQFQENRYKAPRFLLDCGTLRVLTLIHVDLPLPAYFHFCSLTKLDISQANLAQLDTSPCPLLQVLIIRCCNRNLRIYAPNQKLRYLMIVDSIEVLDNDCELTLYAPHLSSIEFRSSLRRFYTFQDLSSLRTATLRFLYMYNSNCDFTHTLVILKLLKDLRHAEVLKLGNCCIETLGYVTTSCLETHLSATYLELATDLDRWELPGFASLLKCFPYLKSLSIDISSSSDELKTTFWWAYDSADIDESKIWEHLGLALSACLNLRTVTIHNFLERDNDWAFYDEDDEIKLVRLMLKQCKVLGKMTVVTSLDPKRAMESELLHTMKEKLLAFPRGSENAEIYISYRS